VSADRSPSLLDGEFFSHDVHAVARALIGCTFLVDGVGGRIVEVEAYAPGDPASHSYRGRTSRNATMFGPAGRLYVYRSYGVHWCSNVVCEPDGVGAAVLLRALEPTAGTDEMRRRRRTHDLLLLCAGPGRLTEALGITGAHDGLAIEADPFRLFGATEEVDVITAPRVGISRASELPWRYALRGSLFVSRPRPRA
jgi:DNA-3-methyladenine glycosylase